MSLCSEATYYKWGFRLGDTFVGAKLGGKNWTLLYGYWSCETTDLATVQED